MTRSRKSTLSVKEFSHLVSEALDFANAPSPPSLVEHTTVVSAHAPKHRPQPSSFQRIFARPTPASPQRADPPHAAPEDLSDTPRKMIAWPFSRSPRKHRSTTKDDNATPVHDPAVYHALSPYAVTSPATTSTSSLGSLIPAHERLFQLASRASDEPSSRLFSAGAVAPSPSAVHPLPSAGDPPTDPGNHAAPGLLHAAFGNGSVNSIHSTVAPTSDTSNQTRTSFEGTEASHSIATSEHESFDDPTPRASPFSPRMASDHSLAARRRRSQPLSLVVPSRSTDVLVLRPAVGAAPHPPSETESSVSVSTSSPTSPVARRSSSTFPTPGTSLRVPPTPPPPNQRISSVLPDIASNVEIASTFGFSPRQRKRAMSRSLTPPPLPRPPPTGPLPAVPSTVPPVPPLPPLLTRLSTNMPLTSPPRPTASGVAPTNPGIAALPPSPPGGLRLPSRLSWANGVRAALPSPPASPTKSLKSLAGKSSFPVSPSSSSKPEKGRPNALKRPKSIGVIEAADGAHVRRTKSILLLGSKSKSNASLGAAVGTATTKRVQIRAEVDLGGAPSHKPRCQSSAPALGRPAPAAQCGPTASAPMPAPLGSELLVLRERRHSAPILSRLNRDAPVPMPTATPMSGASEDWTLSLPFCTDVPGHKILPSPTLTPTQPTGASLVGEHEQEEDWTLCMPLKPRPSTPTTTATKTTEGRESECTLAETTETAQTQLPTPSPSPTQFTSAVRALDPEVGVILPEVDEEEEEERERPMSPASLGPHVGGLDLAGGRGKRASGWHVYGWFDEVTSLAAVEEREVVAASTPVPVPVPAAVPAPTPARVSVPLRVSFPVSPVSPERKRRYIKNHVMAFRKAYYDVVNGRHPSQDSTSSVSTSETIFYSARSSLLVS